MKSYWMELRVVYVIIAHTTFMIIDSFQNGKGRYSNESLTKEIDVSFLST